MKAYKVVFYFRYWQFIFEPNGNTILNGRNYPIWEITIIHKTKKIYNIYSWSTKSFVPSINICRRIKKRICES